MVSERNTILVALGMGLLAGLLAALGIVVFSGATAVAADETIPDLLPGVDLVTEEVEPGVYRVVSDRAGHNLVTEPPSALVFAPDRGLVLFSGPEGRLDRFYTLGEPGELAMPDWNSGDIFSSDAVIDDDGNLIARLAKGGLALFDGDAWTQLSWPNGRNNVSAVEVGPDGATWVTRSSTGSWPRVARIEDDDWTVLPTVDDGTSYRYVGAPENFAVAPDGTAWLATNDGSLQYPLSKDTKALLTFDGETWREPDLPLPLDPRIKQFGPLAIGPDGTLWVYVAGGASGRGPRSLVRLDDGQWSVFTETDGVPRLFLPYGFGARLAVDGEGTLWITSDGDIRDAILPPSLGPTNVPPGIVSFDGSTWRQYLKGHRVNRVTVAEDGSVWATSLGDCTDLSQNNCAEQRGGGLYVITPEAVAAAE